MKDSLTMSKLEQTNSIFKTPYGDVYINYSAKSFGVRLSGGFDSALMLYLLAKSLSENNSNAIVYPMTTKKWNTTDIESFDAADSYVYADRVIEWVRNKFSAVNINNSLKRGAEFWWIPNFVNGQDRSSYLNTQNMLSSYINWQNVTKYLEDNLDTDPTTLLYCEYAGTTKNPSIHLTDFPRGPESHRESNKPNAIAPKSPTVAYFTEYFCEYEPFRNTDKRLTFWLADNLGILEDLLLLTRSCEGNKYSTNNFTQECNECWWCFERNWAHKNFKRTDLE
jgi:hypothetical protein